MSYDLWVVGLNHQTAPVEVRERASVRPEEQAAVLAHLRRHANEVMLLATCNRTEVYLAGVGGDPLSAFEGAWGHALREHLYVFEGWDAAHHLYRVCSGLDSLVLGETQIQGQVKRAWQEASARGDTGPLLNKLAQGALNAGKRVRTGTRLSDSIESVSGAAVRLAEEALGRLSGRRVLVIGAGETAELTLRHLQAAGVSDIWVVNRTLSRAVGLAERLGGKPHPLEDLHRLLPDSDLLIASSAAETYQLRAEQVQGRVRPLFAVDISMPRVLDPALAAVPGVHLYNLDDLQGVVQRSLAGRRALLPQAEGIVAGLLGELQHWHHYRQTRLLQAAAD